MKTLETPAKPVYPFGWPTGKPARERRKPRKKGPRGIGRLTTPAHRPHNGRAFDASGAGRGNPFTYGAQAPTTGRFFVCPVFINGGLGGARFGVAGSHKAGFPPPLKPSPTAVESGRVGSIHRLWSHPMNIPTPTTGEIRPNFTIRHLAIADAYEALGVSLCQAEAVLAQAGQMEAEARP